MGDGQPENLIINHATRERMNWENGSNWLPKMSLKAGQVIDIEVEFNFDIAGITKDWSVSAWGESGPVTVTHESGSTSDSLPFVPKNAQTWLQGQENGLQQPSSYQDDGLAMVTLGGSTASEPSR